MRQLVLLALAAPVILAAPAHAFDWKNVLPFTSPEPPCPFGDSPAGAPPKVIRDAPVIAPKKVAWQDGLGGAEAAQPAIQARLRGWPRAALISAESLPREPSAFLRRLAADTWRGLDALTDRDHALPVDNVRVGRSATIADSHVADYTNITNVGLHLAAVVAAYDLGLVETAAAKERIGATLATLDQLETHRGFFYNYYDTTSLERTSDFLSFVDSAWLTAGLMVVRAAFPELHEQCSKLITRMDFGFFYDSELGQMSHGYYVSRRTHSDYHFGVFYTEARLGSFIAIGKGDVPAANWWSMVRTFPASCRGQRLAPQGSRVVEIDHREVWTGLYDWRGSQYVPSWGGSMFEALMPVLLLDELTLAPGGLGRNDRTHAEVQRRWALEELHYPVWGLSPSATPDGADYFEYGAQVLGSAGYAAGAVSPHASALALAAMPAEAAANLTELAQRYPLYGDFGLYDAVDPISGTVAQKYMALDQSMLFLALANHLTGGAVQKHFGGDPIARAALPLVRDDHTLFE